MLTASVAIDRSFRVGDIDRRLYGSFVEHMGRSVYDGLFEPDHPTADANGFRGDVLDLVRELAVPVIRYPGGNFVSGYDWEDGVGPVAERPARLDLAWQSTEPNLVGTNEFVTWAKRAGAEVMLAVNLGTRGVDAARSLVEYCNAPAGTMYSDLRVSHGYPDPHEIKLWCLGNEMDGPWQIGQKTAIEYGRLAAEAGKAMKLVDPTIELVACGSSHSEMPTFPDWEATVLDLTFDHVEYISLHQYLVLHETDYASFLGESVTMERFIKTVASTADYVAARKRSRKQIAISFDEWNVWYHNRPPRKPIVQHEPWAKAPALIEDTYTMVDALAVGCCLIALLKHVDRVRIACLAQLINVIAPIRTVTGGPAWRQTIFYPFLHASRFGQGSVLDVRVSGPVYDTDQHGEVPYLESTVTVDDESGAVTLFMVNRSQIEPIDVSVDVRSIGPVQLREWIVLSDADPEAANTAEHPDRVIPRLESGAVFDGGTLRAVLAPFSWNVIRLMPVSR